MPPKQATAKDLAKWAAKVKKAQAEQSDRPTFLVYGKMGSGKTQTLGTARKPILIYSFDPGGTKTLRSLIETGDVVVEHYESGDLGSYDEWARSYDQAKSAGILNLFATVCIDSLTTWGDALLKKIVGSVDKQPSLPNYMQQQVVVQNTIKAMSDMPFDLMLTGHIGVQRDEVSGKMTSTLFASPKMAVKIPLLFDEVYVAQAAGSTKGSTVYKLLTQPDGLYDARTRIGGGGLFAAEEEPNIKALLKKAGLDSEDLPRLELGD